MSFNVIPTFNFKKGVKRLQKKYPSLKNDLLELGNQLSANPLMGTPLGHRAYKIRVAIKSKGKGKSGGARIITYVISENKELYLLSIYDKSEMDSIDDKELRNLITQLQS